MDIEGSDITKYQKARLAQGAANRTVNIEVAMLRQVMREGRSVGAPPGRREYASGAPRRGARTID